MCVVNLWHITHCMPYTISQPNRSITTPNVKQNVAVITAFNFYRSCMPIYGSYCLVVRGTVQPIAHLIQSARWYVDHRSLYFLRTCTSRCCPSLQIWSSGSGSSWVCTTCGCCLSAVRWHTVRNLQHPVSRGNTSSPAGYHSNGTIWSPTARQQLSHLDDCKHLYTAKQQLTVSII